MIFAFLKVMSYIYLSNTLPIMLKGKANNTIRFSWFPGSSHPRVGLFKALGLSGPRRHGKGRSSRPGYAKVLPGWDANLARICCWQTQISQDKVATDSTKQSINGPFSTSLRGGMLPSAATQFLFSGIPKLVFSNAFRFTRQVA